MPQGSQQTYQQPVIIPSQSSHASSIQVYYSVIPPNQQNTMRYGPYYKAPLIKKYSVNIYNGTFIYPTFKWVALILVTELISTPSVTFLGLVVDILLVSDP